MLLQGAQAADKELHYIHKNLATLIVSDVPSHAGAWPIICDTSNRTPRVIAPLHFKRGVFEHIYRLSYPVTRATQKTIAQHYVLSGINKDVRR